MLDDVNFWYGYWCGVVFCVLLDVLKATRRYLEEHRS